MKLIDEGKIEQGVKFYRYQQYYRGRNLSAAEALDDTRYDITYDFYHDLKKLIENKRHVTMTITGNTASGKSTVGFWLAEYLIECMKQAKANIDGWQDESLDFKEDLQFNEQYIYNLDEYVSSINNLDPYTVNVIDEGKRSRSYGTGGDVIYQQFNDFQDISAQIFIHSIFISPTRQGIVNPNSLFRLETKGINYEEKTTQALLYVEEDGWSKIIGSVMFDVSEILERDYYDDYREKKMKYISLLKEHNIKNVNELIAYYKSWQLFKDAFLNDINKKTLKTQIQLESNTTNTTSRLIYQTVTAMLDLEKDLYKSKGKFDDDESYMQAKKERLEGIQEGYYGNDMSRRLYEKIFKHIEVYEQYFDN